MRVCKSLPLFKGLEKSQKIKNRMSNPRIFFIWDYFEIQNFKTQVSQKVSYVHYFERGTRGG